MKNSNIMKNPQERHIFDLTKLGILESPNQQIQISQSNHFFQVGDILYYDIRTQLFGKAIAVNNIESEVCGAVLSVQDNDTFTLITQGEIQTLRYAFPSGTPLYLSEIYPGKLISIEPTSVFKQVAIQTDNGIMIDIQRGYKSPNPSYIEELEPYTQDELDEIIKNIW